MVEKVQQYYSVDANVQLANASRKEKENFSKPEIQNVLKSAKNISLFDKKRDGKLGDNEYLVLQAQDDSCSILYSPKKGTTKVDILCELTKNYDIDKDSIPEKIDYENFLQIPVKKDDLKAKENEQMKNILTNSLNKDKMYNFDVRIEKVDNVDMAILSCKSNNLSTFQKFIHNEQPSYGYIKEKAGLGDGVLTRYNNIYDCAGRRKPDRSSVPVRSNNFDTWTLEPDRELRIPVSELFKR